MGWFDFLRRKAKPQSSVVTFDEQGVTCRRSNGLVESVTWDDLRAVIIKTTSGGPFVDDVFWVLVGKRSGCVVPSEAEGASQLLPRLQDLPGFDNHKFMDAMSCTDDRDFSVWQRPEAS